MAPVKRQNFASALAPAAKASRVYQGPSTLVACVRAWGSAFWVFEGTARNQIGRVDVVWSNCLSCHLAGDHGTA